MDQTAEADFETFPELEIECEDENEDHIGNGFVEFEVESSSVGEASEVGCDDEPNQYIENGFVEFDQVIISYFCKLRLGKNIQGDESEGYECSEIHGDDEQDQCIGNGFVEFDTTEDSQEQVQEVPLGSSALDSYILLEVARCALDS